MTDTNDKTLDLINQLTLRTRELSGLLLNSEIQFSVIIRRTTKRLIDIHDMSNNEETNKIIRDIIRDLNSDYQSSRTP